jgi:glycerol-3-phosphate acyltransferase PlsY
MKELLIEQASQLVVTIVVTLLGFLSTWLTVKLTKYVKIKNLTSALNTCLAMTQVTVGELQQKFVEGMKAANVDGKLTKEEIKDLNSSLVTYTRNKLTPSIINIITAAGIDINQFILDAGENYVQELKHE